jgi:hypothetical protein
MNSRSLSPSKLLTMLPSQCSQIAVDPANAAAIEQATDLRKRVGPLLGRNGGTVNGVQSVRKLRVIHTAAVAEKAREMRY